MKLAHALTAFDDALLDRVFQPLADRLPERIAAFDLGMSLQLGAIVLDAASDVALFAAGLLGPSRAAFDALNWALGVWFYRYLSRQRGLVRPGMLNPLRIAFRAMRLLAVAFCLWSAFSMFGNRGPDLLSALFSALANTVFTAGIYFMSCTPRPPGQATARRRAGRLRVVGSNA